MKKYNNRVSEINIAYIGGGSRGWAWTFMTDLALDDQISGTIRLYDLDKKAAENNEIIGNHLMQRDDAKGNWKFVVSDSMKEALTGCDFVVISILPGTFDEMAVDVHMPERLGIYQSVGDTAGLVALSEHSGQYRCMLKLLRLSAIIHLRHGSLTTRIQCRFASGLSIMYSRELRRSGAAMKYLGHRRSFRGYMKTSQVRRSVTGMTYT